MALVTFVGITLLIVVVAGFAVLFQFVQRHTGKDSPKFL